MTFWIKVLNPPTSCKKNIVWRRLNNLMMNNNCNENFTNEISVKNSKVLDQWHPKIVWNKLAGLIFRNMVKAHFSMFLWASANIVKASLIGGCGSNTPISAKISPKAVRNRFSHKHLQYIFHETYHDRSLTGGRYLLDICSAKPWGRRKYSPVRLTHTPSLSCCLKVREANLIIQSGLYSIKVVLSKMNNFGTT